MGWPRCQLMCILGLYIYVCGENHIGYICELFSTAVDACEETEVASTVCAECLTGRRRRLLARLDRRMVVESGKPNLLRGQ